MKGILLAGGRGSRLAPLTCAVSKQLLPIYDKPLIYYPLSTLMLAGIREILVITAPQHQDLFKTFLRDGSQWGIELSYQIQPAPEGIAQAFPLAKNFIDGKPCCLILGDNLFYGQGLIQLLQKAATLQSGAKIFAYEVRDPSAYGVVTFNKDGVAVAIDEKPATANSKFAIPGLYFYDHRVCDLAQQLAPSTRGELEITDLNRIYLNEGTLQVEVFGRGTAWLDTGTPESLHDASSFVGTIEKRTGLKVACPEEIAFRQNWISLEQLRHQATRYANSDYGHYLERLAGSC